MRQHSFAKNLNVSFRIRIYVQNLEFAFERPSTVVHTFQHHLLPIWHVSIHLILCSVYQRKIQQWKFFILLFSKFQVFHRCNHISKIFSNRGSVSFFILMRNFCSLLNSKSTSSNETPNSGFSLENGYEKKPFVTCECDERMMREIWPTVQLFVY